MYMLETEPIDAHLKEIEKPIHSSFYIYPNGTGFSLIIQEDLTQPDDFRLVKYEIDQNKIGKFWRVGEDHQKIDNNPLPDYVVALVEISRKAIEANYAPRIQANIMMEAGAKAFFSDKLSEMPSASERAHLTYLQDKLFANK